MHDDVAMNVFLINLQCLQQMRNLMQVWPVKEPDIMVSTPAALLNYLCSIDPERRRRSEFIRSVKYVVIFLDFFYLVMRK